MSQEVSGAAGARTVAALDSALAGAPGMKKRMTYTEFLDNSPLSGLVWLVLVGCVLAQILDGFDFQSTSFALPQLAREFHINPTQAGAIGSLTNTGLLFGALLAGPLSDRFGRRPLFQWALFLYAFGTMLSALAPSYHFLLGARFVTGLGIAAEMPVAMVMLAEYAPKRLRHIFVGGGAIGYSFGWFVCAVVATFVVPRFGWRTLYWIGVSPALMIIFVRRYIPESVRFLLSKGRVQEAGAIVRRFADSAGYPDVELVAPETVKPKGKLSLGQQVAAQFSVLKAFALIIFVIALYQTANHIQVVGINTWLPSIFVRQGFNLKSSIKFTMIIMAATPVGQILGIWLQDKMPRKWAMLLLAAISALCFFAAGLGFEYKLPIEAIVACIVGYQFFSGGVVPIVTTLTSESFPTAIRSSAYALTVSFARSGSILGPLLLGFFLTLGTQIHQIIYYFTLPLVVAAVLVVIFLKVDTRQKTLEEVSGA